MTRARARQIHGQVLSLLYTHDLTDGNTMLHSCSALLVLRNKGEIRDEDNYALKSDELTVHACPPPNQFHSPSMSRACTCMKCTRTNGFGLMSQDQPRTWALDFLAAPGASTHALSCNLPATSASAARPRPTVRMGHNDGRGRTPTLNK